MQKSGFLTSRLIYSSGFKICTLPSLSGVVKTTTEYDGKPCFQTKEKHVVNHRPANRFKLLENTDVQCLPQKRGGKCSIVLENKNMHSL